MKFLCKDFIIRLILGIDILYYLNFINIIKRKSDFNYKFLECKNIVKFSCYEGSIFYLRVNFYLF